MSIRAVTYSVQLMERPPVGAVGKTANGLPMIEVGCVPNPLRERVQTIRGLTTAPTGPILPHRKPRHGQRARSASRRTSSRCQPTVVSLRSAGPSFALSGRVPVALAKRC